MAATRSKAAMNASEAALVDVVKLVVSGQGDAVPRKVQHLVRGSGARSNQGLSKSCRDALEALVHPERRVRRVAGLREALAATPLSRQSPEGEIPAERADDPILPADVRQRVEAIVEEQRAAGVLAEAGLDPTRSLLLSGPPGVGKTMTARSISAHLDLPLVAAAPSTIMTSLLGESARNLAQVFDGARESPCVLLLDEFDAFAKRRDDSHEVGELKRFVTTLLGELEVGLPDGLLIAATNHPDLLDPAVHRRFDHLLEIPLPGASTRAELLAAHLDRLDLQAGNGALQAVVACTDGLSAADLVTLTHGAARDHLLRERSLDLTLLTAALGFSVDRCPDAEAAFARLAHEKADLSTRAIGDLLGCSHTRVQRLLKASS